MNKQIARVTWSRGVYSDILRTAIVEPSPIKEGQRVSVIWGKSKKEYSAVLTCYPLVEGFEEPASTPVQEDLPRQRRAKAKRKLVSCIFTVPISPSSLSFWIWLYHILIIDNACYGHPMTNFGRYLFALAFQRRWKSVLGILWSKRGLKDSHWWNHSPWGFRKGRY